MDTPKLTGSGKMVPLMHLGDGRALYWLDDGSPEPEVGQPTGQFITLYPADFGGWYALIRPYPEDCAHMETLITQPVPTWAWKPEDWVSLFGDAIWLPDQEQRRPSRAPGAGDSKLVFELQPWTTLSGSPQSPDGDWFSYAGGYASGVFIVEIDSVDGGVPIALSSPEEKRRSLAPWALWATCRHLSKRRWPMVSPRRLQRARAPPSRT